MYSTKHTYGVYIFTFVVITHREVISIKQPEADKNLTTVLSIVLHPVVQEHQRHVIQVGSRYKILVQVINLAYTN